MRFLRDGTVGHGTRLKSLDDALYALYFFERNLCSLGICEIKCTSKCDLTVVGIDLGSKLLIHIVRTVSCSKLQEMDRLRIVKVLLLAAS